MIPTCPKCHRAGVQQQTFGYAMVPMKRKKDDRNRARCPRPQCGWKGFIFECGRQYDTKNAFGPEMKTVGEFLNRTRRQ